MSTIEHLKQLFDPVFRECGVILYELKWTGSGKDRTLEVAIMREDGSMDLDTCAEVSEKLSDILDSSDISEAAYTLEVCSPGAEREIRDLKELSTMDQPYVYVRLKHPAAKMIEITGTVTAYDGETITMSYRDKAAAKSVAFPADDVEFMRLAVKF
ncbi:MAG: ribosome maturation factor RimP [Solobacterium sp.]|nr:ribosome maturation factor RimP [Solobacterium sp.]